MSPETLNRLAKQISEGDQHAFKKLFNHFYPELLHYAQYLLESCFAAEEVVSAVFIKMWQQRNRICHISNLASYMFIAVKNHCCNYLRDNKYIQFKEHDTEKSLLKASFETPESSYLSEELRNIILASIEELPARCKMIFRMVREDGLRYKEVAELLDISEKTVETQMGRAVTKLKTALELYANDAPRLLRVIKLVPIIVAIGSMSFLCF